MRESERLQRYREKTSYHNCADGDAEKEDEKLANRIMLLLNNPKIDKYCMVDAYYYDFSVIPREIQEKLQLWRDSYLIFGITTEGEIVSKWVDRWDLDSDNEVVNGKVIRKNKQFPENGVIPEINQCYDPNLLSTPCPSLLSNLFVN